MHFIYKKLLIKKIFNVQLFGIFYNINYWSFMTELRNKIFKYYIFDISINKINDLECFQASSSMGWKWNFNQLEIDLTDQIIISINKILRYKPLFFLQICVNWLKNSMFSLKMLLISNIFF